MAEAPERVFRVDAKSIDKDGWIIPPRHSGFTKLIIDVDEETAKKGVSLRLFGNPVTTIEGVEKLVAVRTVILSFCRFATWPKWIEKLTAVKYVNMRLGEIKEIPASFFEIPTIEKVVISRVSGFTKINFRNLSPTLKKLEIYDCDIDSLPEDFFHHGFEQVVIQNCKSE